MRQPHENHQEEESYLKKKAKQSAKKAIKKQVKKIAKKVAKKVALAAIKAAIAATKFIVASLLTLGTPFLLIIGAIVLLVIVVYLSTTVLFTSPEVDLPKEADDLKTYIIKESEKTVDPDKREQAEFKVPPDLVIAALNIYESQNGVDADSKEAAKTMIDALKPKFTYTTFEGRTVNTQTHCTKVEGKEKTCEETTKETPFEVTVLESVEAWDRVLNSTFSPHTSETFVSESSWIEEGEEGDPDKTITRISETFSETKVEHEVVNEDYTYFDRVLMDEPFNYGPEDIKLVEALYQTSGGTIRYSEWMSSNSLVGFNGIVTPGSNVPSEFMEHYLAAEKVYKVDWYYLAALHSVETQFSTHPTMISSVGAEGHFQFMPCTWTGWNYPGCVGGVGQVDIPKDTRYDPIEIRRYGGYGVDADENGTASPWEIKDAVFTAASYLNKNGYAQSIDKALFAYNRADWYVEKVKKKANEIRQAASYAPNMDAMPELAPGSFMRPALGNVTGDFGYYTVGGSRKRHYGVDIANAQPNVPVVAAADGVVIASVSGCNQVGHLGDRCGGGWGNHVIVRHEVEGETFFLVYAHFKNNATHLNQKVKQGELLGIMGTSGQSTGVHLHLEVHRGGISGKQNVINPHLVVPI